MDSDLKRRRIVTVAAIVAVAVVIALVAYGNIGGNLVYYWSPKEVHAAGNKAVGATIRLGGLVEPGSIQRTSTGLDLKFKVTDGDATVPVHASQLYSRNLTTFLSEMVKDGTLNVDMNNDVVGPSCAVHAGEAKHPRIQAALAAKG